MPVILIAIADCKQRKGAITCVCVCTGEFLIQFYCIFIFVQEFPTFQPLESIYFNLARGRRW